MKIGSTWRASPRVPSKSPPPPKRPSVRPKPETQEALRKKIRSALPSKPVNMKHRNIGTERRVIVLKHIGIQSWNYVHQQHACHFKMPFWLVDRHKSPVGKVNMAEIPVNRTPPCIQAQTIPIQDTVLSTGHIVLLTGQLPCSHGLPCEQGSTM